MRKIFRHIALAVAFIAPSAALAQETSSNGIKVEKRATCENGIGEITIEAFATAPSIRVGGDAHLPTDVVLVLDVSGSMSDKTSFNGKNVISSGELTVGQTYRVSIDGKEYYLKGFQTGGGTGGYTAQNGSWSYDKVKAGNYYYKDGSKYYEVHTESDYSLKKGKYTDFRLYYLKPKAIGFDVIYLSGSGTTSKKSTVSESNKTIYTGTLYTKGNVESKYIYRYGTSEPSNASSGQEFYTGTKNFSVGDKASVSSYQIYTTSSTSVTKLEALKTSVNGFISNLAADSRESGVEHRISLVKFAGTNSNSIGNVKYGSGYNNTQIINGFISAKDNESSLKSTVSSLTAGGGTRANDGMAHAKDLVMGSSSRNLQGSDAWYKSQGISEYSKVVILFTDGEPGDYGFNTSYRGANDYSNGWYVANKTIGISKDIKDSGARVYTIGVLANPSENVKHYLELVSSDYPTAEKGFEYSSKSSSLITTYPKKNEGYCNVTGGSDLGDIFQDIAFESYRGHSEKIELDGSTILKDIIDPDFNLPEGATAGDIKVFVSKCTGCESDDSDPENNDIAEFTFSDESSQVYGKGTGSVLTPDPASPGFGNISASISSDNGTDRIVVTGFSYKDYWCGNYDSNGSMVLHAGYKLIVKIPFTISEYHEDRSVYETNEPESGIFINSGETRIVGLPIPKLYGIIIVRNGLQEGESAIFKVYEAEGDGWSSTPVYTTMIVGDSNAQTADIQVIAALNDGYYKVVEDSGWSWTYENGNPSVEHMLSESDNVTFEFSGGKKTPAEGKDIIQNAESTVINEMKGN